MFCSSPGAFEPNFQPENCLTSMQEVECYKTRAKALISRFPWSDALRPVWTASLVHMSANVPGKVAYYANVKSMMENRLTRTSPEMFLQRTLQYAPEHIQAAWTIEVLGQTLPEVHFIENTDPDGWERVYNNGPHSCMAGSTRVRQYAHPNNNLALAYVTEGPFRITHRAIVNKERMTYLRVYGRDPAYFVAALNKLGYRQSHETLHDELIRLRYQECSNCTREVLVGPYLDGAYSGVTTISRKEGTVGGFIEMDYGEEPHCGNCEEDSDEDF